MKETRDEVYTLLSIVCLDMKGGYQLQLKVDTGASGNTLPTRIVKDMYGNKWMSKLTPLGGTKHTTYNGSEIKCHGTLKVLCQYKDSDWFKYKSNVVKIPGPAVLGLPAC